jgi:hypothetical protein
VTTESKEHNDLEAAAKAILMLLIDQRKRQGIDEDKGFIEALLYQAGFTRQADIVALTGTPRSTVLERLKAKGLT